MHKLIRNGFEGLNTSIDPHTFMYFKAPVHGSSIPGYISREGYIARLTYPQRLCSLYGGLWASRVTLRSLLVCIPSEEGWFPLLSLLMEKTMVLNLTLQEFKEARKIQVTMIFHCTWKYSPRQVLVILIH